MESPTVAPGLRQTALLRTDCQTLMTVAPAGEHRPTPLCIGTLCMGFDGQIKNVYKERLQSIKFFFAVLRSPHPMLSDLFPFQLHIDSTTVAGVGLWALALYLGFSPLSDWVMEQLARWFNYAERSLYTSQEEFDRTKPARESQNAFYASLFSVIPFVVVGGVFNYFTDVSLGRSWAISLGILAAIGAGVYELGRRDGQERDEG